MMLRIPVTFQKDLISAGFRNQGRLVENENENEYSLSIPGC